MPDGTVRPSVLAVFRLIASSNLVGLTTGNSLGFSARPACRLPRVCPYELESRSTQMYRPCFQIMYAQSGTVPDANARLPKMSAIENTIPNTIPVSTVFIGKLLASSGTSPFRTMSKMRRWCCVIGHRGDLPRIHGAQCSMRKLKLLVLMYRARLAVALCFQRLQK